MANLLYLVHRMPYPPDKGDKVRSYHLMKHLVREHRVFLGTFIDDPEDEQYLGAVQSLCADVHAVRLHPKRARIRSLAGLLHGDSLTLHYYRDAGLARWVESVLAAQPIDAAVVFSSSMAQYAEDRPALPMLVDFVDVDSAKWSHYANTHRWPLSWLYRREGRRLLDYERAVAAKAARSFFSTEQETALFCGLAPETAAVIEPLSNGVDTTFFAPDAQRASPFGADEIPLVFTGAMDYVPNIDAVTWFAEQVLPGLRAAWPRLRFHVVGRNPSAAVRALAGSAISVSGTVSDVRPYLQHAAVVVAPLRIARGIQNKILEAMAMARPVVASSVCAAAVDAVIGTELLAAESPADFVRQICGLLASPEAARELGAAARRRSVHAYSWQAHLSGLDRHLPSRRSDSHMNPNRPREEARAAERGEEVST